MKTHTEESGGYKRTTRTALTVANLKAIMEEFAEEPDLEGLISQCEARARAVLGHRSKYPPMVAAEAKTLLDLAGLARREIASRDPRAAASTAFDLGRCYEALSVMIADAKRAAATKKKSAD